MEKLIHLYMSKENTWVLQKLPIVAFQYIDKLLSEFQLKIFEVLKDFRQNQKLSPEKLREYLRKDIEQLQRANEDANRIRLRTTRITHNILEEGGELDVFLRNINPSKDASILMPSTPS